MSKNNTIKGNAISNHFSGIYLGGNSTTNIITGNNIKNQYNWGGVKCIWLKDSSSNHIYLNNFIRSAVNFTALSENSTNTWHSPAVLNYSYSSRNYTNYLGNYWSDYTRSDIDGDGIGDTPHSINSDKDNFPLMESFENYWIGEPPQAVDSTHSTVEVAPASVPADGTSTATITVTLRDGTGSPITDGRTVQVTSNRPEDVIAPASGYESGYESWQSDASGLFKATISSTTVGDATITVVADGVELSQDPMVSFCAIPLSARYSSIDDCSPVFHLLRRRAHHCSVRYNECRNDARQTQCSDSGGRGPDGEVVDFHWQEDVILGPNASHNYVGDLILPGKPGTYHFFCTYQTEDGYWNPSVYLGPGLTDDDRVKDIHVAETVMGPLVSTYLKQSISTSVGAISGVPLSRQYSSKRS